MSFHSASALCLRCSPRSPTAHRTYHHDIFTAYTFDVNSTLHVAAVTTPALNEVSVIDNITLALANQASASPFFSENLGLKTAFRASAQFRFWFLLFIVLTPSLPFGPGAPFAVSTYMLAEYWMWELFPRAVGFSFFPNWVTVAVVGSLLGCLVMYMQKRSEIGTCAIAEFLTLLSSALPCHALLCPTLLLARNSRDSSEIWAQVNAGISDLEDKKEEIHTLQKEKEEIEKKNKQIQNQLQQVKLSSKQTAMIELSKEKFVEKLHDLHVDAFREITFHDRLGEGCTLRSRRKMNTNE